MKKKTSRYRWAFSRLVFHGLPGKRKTYTGTSPPLFSKKAMQWGKKWPVQMNLPFFRCRSICTGGGPESGGKKNEKMPSGRYRYKNLLFQFAPFRLKHWETSRKRPKRPRTSPARETARKQKHQRRTGKRCKFSETKPSPLPGQFQVQVCLVTERAISWQMHLSLVLKAFGSLISLMSWEWTNRNAANRHLELPGLRRCLADFSQRNARICWQK